MRRLSVTHMAADRANGSVDMADYPQQFETAVQVRIEEKASESQCISRSLSDARLHGDIGIHAVTARAVQRDHLVIEIRNRETGHSRIVEVGGVDSHTRPRLAMFAERHP